MKMENMQSIDAVREHYGRSDLATLIGQQVGLRASIHCLEWLIAHRGDGATPELLLESVRSQLFVLHEVAAARGVNLLSYS